MRRSDRITEVPLHCGSVPSFPNFTFVLFPPVSLLMNGTSECEGVESAAKGQEHLGAGSRGRDSGH